MGLGCWTAGLGWLEDVGSDGLAGVMGRLPGMDSRGVRTIGLVAGTVVPFAADVSQFSKPSCWTGVASELHGAREGRSKSRVLEVMGLMMDRRSEGLGLTDGEEK